MKAIHPHKSFSPVLCSVCLAAAAVMTCPQEIRAADMRRTDPSWKPALNEVNVIQIGKTSKGGSVHNYCVNVDGNLLVCCGGKFQRLVDERRRTTESVTEPTEMRVYSPEGKLLETWPQPCKLQAVCADRTGTIFAGGSGRILRLDQQGKVMASAETPVADEPIALGKDIEDMLKEQRRFNEAEMQKMKSYLERRRGDVTGIAVTTQDVFVACPAPSDFTYRVYRFDHDLKNPKLIVEKLRGCCGQMDIQAHDGKLWIPHNARHQVECHDRDGKLVAKFGKAGRVRPQQFGGCCEPKNMRFTAKGDILAAESGPPTCIKRFTVGGEFLDVLAMPDGMKGDCVRVTVDVSPDGKQFYMLDTAKDTIRVFAAK